jgi:hypothetical protein
MRLSEFINVDALDAEIIEDDAEDQGHTNLVTALEFLRHRSRDKMLQPKVRVDSLIEMVRNTGAETFNLDSLTNAFKNNESVKGLIKDIKDDEHGVKYVFLKEFSDLEVDDEPAIAYGAKDDNPDKVVKQMAKRATSK